MKEWPGWVQVSIGVLFGLVIGALILLIARQPSGESIKLLPIPSPAPIQVHVTGAVNVEGVYSLPKSSRVQQAIDAAGGAAQTANLSAINLAAPLVDGQQIVIPEKGETVRSQALSVPLININTASKEELMALPGIGEGKADAIIAYRSQKGGFLTIDEIMNVDGIGPGTFDNLKELISVVPQP